MLWSFVPAPRQRNIQVWTIRGAAFVYLAISLLEGAAYFGDAPGLLEPIADLRAAAPFVDEVLHEIETTYGALERARVSRPVSQRNIHAMGSRQ